MIFVKEICLKSEAKMKYLGIKYKQIRGKVKRFVDLMVLYGLAILWNKTKCNQ